MYCSTVVYTAYMLAALLLPTTSTSETERVTITTPSVMTSSPEEDNFSTPSTLLNEPPTKQRGQSKTERVAMTTTSMMTSSTKDNNSTPSFLVNEPPTKQIANNRIMTSTHEETLVNEPPTKRTDNNRVMYGDKASISQFPYIVSVQKPYGHHSCGGTLVHADWVLTATHCLVYQLTYMYEPRLFYVFAGHTNVLRPVMGHPDSRRVTATFIHDTPSITRSRRHDIGLIRLSSPYVLRDTIQLVTLPPLRPPQQHYDDDDPASSRCVLAGWGHHVTEPEGMKHKIALFKQRNRDFGWLGERLHYAELERINTSTCQARWLAAANVTSVIHKKHVCTSGVAGKDACKGDSGGPLMCGDVQVGVVSYVYTCGRNVTPPNPVVYVRVAHYVQWIDDTLRANDVPVMTQDDLEREARLQLMTSESAHKRQITSGANRDEASVVVVAIGIYFVLKLQS